MEEFVKEVKNMSTNELIIIIEDQEELYSKEEFEILKKELNSRKENKSTSKSELINEIMEEALEEEIEKEIKEESKKIEENREREVREYRQRLERLEEDKKDKLRNLKLNGIDEYCEYKVLKFADSFGGSLNILNFEHTLNSYALDGWRVKASYTNELGKYSNMSGFGGITSGTNSTNDEHIIILERVIKIKGE